MYGTWIETTMPPFTLYYNIKLDNNNIINTIMQVNRNAMNARDSSFH